MEEDHEKLEETMRSEHEVSVASYIAEAELVTEVIRALSSHYDIGCFPSLSLIDVFAVLRFIDLFVCICILSVF